MVVVVLLIAYEYRLIYYESYTYIAYSAPKPVQVTEESGIHILLVRSFEVQYLKDNNYIKEVYEKQFQPIISLEKITNQERYQSKNSEIKSILGFKRDAFSTMRKNVMEYLGKSNASIDDFLHRDDIQGDSAGLGLALTALVNQGDINNNLDFGVTGALNSNGDVMAVGSIKEKMIISEENDLPYIILPTSNTQEAKFILEDQNLNLDIFPVSHIDQAIKIINELNKNSK